MIDTHVNGDVPSLTEPDLLDDASAPYPSFAEQQAARWFVTAGVLLVVLLVALVTIIVLLSRQRVEPFVVVIRENDSGQVVLVEPLRPLRDFVMPAEAILYALPRFVGDLRWLSLDTAAMDDRERSVKAQVCGPAVQQWQRPVVREAAQVAVNIESVLPTESPMTWRVEWLETWADVKGHPLGDHRYRGHFTLKRFVLDYKQKDQMAVWLRNPLGLCVASYQLSEVP